MPGAAHLPEGSPAWIEQEVQAAQERVERAVDHVQRILDGPEEAYQAYLVSEVPDLLRVLQRPLMLAPTFQGGLMPSAAAKGTAANARRLRDLLLDAQEQARLDGAHAFPMRKDALAAWQAEEAALVAEWAKTGKVSLEEANRWAQAEVDAWGEEVLVGLARALALGMCANRSERAFDRAALAAYELSGTISALRFAFAPRGSPMA